MTSDAAHGITVKKVDTLWFSPDVVVLRANNRIFRVFVAILKTKSSVFADMFAFPQPPSSERETIEGSPVVDLLDDPEELEVFLQAIFDAESFLPPPEITKFPDIIAVLRLSHKYDVPFLRRRALEHLETIYAHKVNKYITVGPEHTGSIDFSYFIDPQDPHPELIHLVSIEVLTEVGATWLLPAAFYMLCDHELKDVLSADRNSWDDLGEMQKMAFIEGRSALIEYYPTFIPFHFMELHGCQHPPSCINVRFSSTMEHSVLHNQRRPLEAVDQRYWTSLEQKLCSTCYEAMKVNHTSAQEKFWQRLPEMFGLPDWYSLRRQRREQLGLPSMSNSKLATTAGVRVGYKPESRVIARLCPIASSKQQRVCECARARTLSTE